MLPRSRQVARRADMIRPLRTPPAPGGGGASAPARLICDSPHPDPQPPNEIVCHVCQMSQIDPPRVADWCRIASSPQPPPPR